MPDSDDALEAVPVKIPTTIDKTTLVPISIAVSIIISFLAAWGWLDTRFTTIGDKIDAQTKTYDERFQHAERRLERVEARAEGSWTIVDETLWVSEFRRLNPEMKIPEIKRR